ncbi:hypothetical protein TanjilG_17541 [Lupinus angustifolius]|uniref:Uncharacterized protein n=1 Tax=Lupinus angustifolius TaxID=3871 RepID=A0A1J7IE73_LUPAN|nr:hypothetical protein TanjilG_17541 [Lupinus angustifolius]
MGKGLGCEVDGDGMAVELDVFLVEQQCDRLQLKFVSEYRARMVLRLFQRRKKKLGLWHYENQRNDER